MQDCRQSMDDFPWEVILGPGRPFQLVDIGLESSFVELGLDSFFDQSILS